MVVKSDNSVWFTDPPFGILGNYEGHVATPELPTNVYRIDAGTGQLSVITGEINRPNGLCFSPDETKLYVIEAGVTRAWSAHMTWWTTGLEAPTEGHLSLRSQAELRTVFAAM